MYPSLPVASQLSLSQLIGLQPSFPDRVRSESPLFTHKQTYSPRLYSQLTTSQKRYGSRNEMVTVFTFRDR